MESIRSSTMVLHDKNKRSIASSQNTIAKLTDQITSGKESRDFIGIVNKGNIEGYLGNKSIAESIDLRIKNNELLTHKISAIEDGILSLQDIVKDGLVLAMRARDPSSGNTLNSDDLSRQQLYKIYHVMQKEFNGQYLYAGSDVKNIPVADFITNSNLSLGVPTANYYRGNDDTMSAKISNTYNVKYGFKANDPAVQKLIGAFHKIIEAKTTNTPALYGEAVDLLNDAKTSLSSTLMSIASNHMTIEKQIEDDIKLKLRLDEKITDVESADIPIKMAEMSNTQAQLQASYALMARVNSLNLVDYLR